MALTNALGALSLEATQALIKADIATLKADIATVKADTATMKADTTTTKNDIATIKQQGIDAAAQLTGATALNINGQALNEGNPMPTLRSQGALAFATPAATAGTPAQLFAADPTRRGARILNPFSVPIYITKATAGTPPSGPGSEYVPAAYNGEPGQFNFTEYRPVDEFRFVTAATGVFTVITW